LSKGKKKFWMSDRPKSGRGKAREGERTKGSWVFAKCGQVGRGTSGGRTQKKKILEQTTKVITVHNPR